MNIYSRITIINIDRKLYFYMFFIHNITIFEYHFLYLARRRFFGEEGSNKEHPKARISNNTEKVRVVSKPQISPILPMGAIISPAVPQPKPITRLDVVLAFSGMISWAITTTTELEASMVKPPPTRNIKAQGQGARKNPKRKGMASPTETINMDLLRVRS